MDTRRKQGVEALERAFELLNAFRDAPSRLMLAELAQRTKFHKSTILRMAVSLERYGYLTRLADGSFALGSTLLQLGKLYQGNFRLTDAVRPTLVRLSAQTRESASYWIPEGDYRVCLCRVESSQHIRDALFQEGDRLLMDKGPTSTLFQAFAGAKGRRFDEVRRDAAVVSLGQFRADVAGIACPVFSAGGGIAGAVTLTGPRQRFDERAIARMKPAVKEAAAEIQRNMA